MQIKKLSDVNLKLVGEGANAKVYRAYFKDPKSQRTFVYAIKVATKRKVSTALTSHHNFFALG